MQDDHASQGIRKQAELIFRKGVKHLQQGDSSLAEECFRTVSRLCPELGEAQVNLGWLLEQRGDLDAAEQTYLQALQNGVQNPEIFLNLGAMALAREQLETACKISRAGLALYPRSAALWSNLGMAQACRKQDTEAEISYRTALQHQPDLASARFNLAYILLRHGCYEEGFACLEARDWYTGLDRLLTQELGIRRWEGNPLYKHSILITCEAGHGDMIQFCRYAHQLKLAGAKRVGILCHPALVRLFGSLKDADDIYSIEAQIPKGCWNYWSPALSLPHFCSTTLHNIPASLPYLQGSPDDFLRWRKQLSENTLKVGLVWRGNPNFENDRHRSLPELQILTPLWSVAGVSFICLQKGRGEEEISSLPSKFAITIPDPGLQDFADTAALLSNLDLLISVDTGCAHLAGALGIPCWVLLPLYKTDWRWLTEDRTDSPWYPNTMRLFRQNQKDNWNPVISELTEALRAKALAFTARSGIRSKPKEDKGR